MSNLKTSLLKHHGDHDPLRVKLVKSPKDSQLLRPDSSFKVKKENDLVKKESDSALTKNLLDKRPLVTPVKKNSTVINTTVRKDVENVKAVKKEPHALNKENAGLGKVKTVAKQEVAVSRGSMASSNVAQKKKKRSKEEAEKKEKKVYDLPGQKHNPPEERDPLRIFYESLYQQNPKSEMAEVWMMEHGLLATDAAKKAIDRKKRNQLSQKMASPVKSVTGKRVEKTSSKNVTMKIEKKRSPALNGDSKFSKVKRHMDSDDDDDFILKPKKKLKTTV